MSGYRILSQGLVLFPSWSLPSFHLSLVYIEILILPSIPNQCKTWWNHSVLGTNGVILDSRHVGVNHGQVGSRTAQARRLVLDGTYVDRTTPILSLIQPSDPSQSPSFLYWIRLLTEPLWSQEPEQEATAFCVLNLGDFRTPTSSGGLGLDRAISLSVSPFTHQHVIEFSMIGILECDLGLY